MEYLIFNFSQTQSLPFHCVPLQVQCLIFSFSFEVSFPFIRPLVFKTQQLFLSFSFFFKVHHLYPSIQNSHHFFLLFHHLFLLQQFCFLCFYDHAFSQVLEFQHFQDLYEPLRLSHFFLLQFRYPLLRYLVFRKLLAHHKVSYQVWQTNTLLE